MKKTFAINFLIVCLGILLFGCSTIPTEMASGASGTELSGSVVDLQGNAVIGAVVRLRHKNFLAGDSLKNTVSANGTRSIADTVTNGLGEYLLESIDTGDYSIEVNFNDSIAKLLPCKILITEPFKKIGKDTLVPMSVVSGHFDAIDTNNIPDSSAHIQIYGLDRQVKPDSNGNFSIRVPNGNLNLKFSMDTGRQNEMDVKINVAPNENRNIGSFRLGHSPKAPPSPCQGGNCDSSAVRAFLDSLKLYDVAVDVIAKTRNGRIVELNLGSRSIANIPVGLERLDALEVIDLGNNALSVFPESLVMLRNLKKLFLNNNHLTELTPSIGKIRMLQELDLSNNALTTLPDSLTSLTMLQYLYLENNSLCGLSPTLAAWAETYDPGWSLLQTCL